VAYTAWGKNHKDVAVTFTAHNCRMRSEKDQGAGKIEKERRIRSEHMAVGKGNAALPGKLTWGKKKRGRFGRERVRA